MKLNFICFNYMQPVMVETPPVASNTKTRNQGTVQGHTGTGALRPRVKGQREQGEIGVEGV